MNNLRQVKDISEYHAEPDAEYFIDREGKRGLIAIGHLTAVAIKDRIKRGELYIKPPAPTIKAVWMMHPHIAHISLFPVNEVERQERDCWQVVNVEVMSDE